MIFFFFFNGQFRNRMRFILILPVLFNYIVNISNNFGSLRQIGDRTDIHMIIQPCLSHNMCDVTS